MVYGLICERCMRRTLKVLRLLALTNQTILLCCLSFIVSLTNTEKESQVERK